jgi:uncharacterized membrane protein YfcA
MRVLSNKRLLALSGFLLAWCAVYFGLMPQPWDHLSSNWLFILVGFAGAIVGNSTAIGGGLVFIPVLIFGYQVPAVAALKASIVTQAFGMTSGAFAWHGERKIPWRVVPWALPGLIIGSSISSLIIHPNAMLIKGLFGPVSIVLGSLLLVMLFRTSKEKAESWNGRAKAATVVASFIGGLLTGWVAIGEGEIVAATLMLAFGFAAQSAIALGVVLLSLTSIYLASLHIFVLGGVPWDIAAFTVLGCVFGAQLAPALAKRTNPRTLKAYFAVIAILDGLLFVYQFLLWSNH